MMVGEWSFWESICAYGRQPTLDVNDLVYDRLLDTIWTSFVTAEGFDALLIRLGMLPSWHYLSVAVLGRNPQFYNNPG